MARHAVLRKPTSPLTCTRALAGAAPKQPAGREAPNSSRVLGSFGRGSSLLRNAGLGAALAVAAGPGPALFGAPPWVAVTILIVGFVILAMAGWIVPMYPRNDLHSDLLRLEVIRP